MSFTKGDTFELQLAFSYYICQRHRVLADQLFVIGGLGTVWQSNKVISFHHSILKNIVFEHSFTLSTLE